MNHPKERPILFQPAMVRALLAGTKTQTRRLVKLSDPSQTYAGFNDNGWPWTMDEAGEPHDDPCPYGVPGDRLWVKETHQYLKAYGERGELYDYWSERCEGDRPDYIEYLATCKEGHHPDKWRPSIHMHRWASRLTLEIVSVRVERVQSITRADAIAEGFDDTPATQPDWEGKVTGLVCDAADNFLRLFYDINKRAPRDKNPWVWVLEFRRIK